MNEYKQTSVLDQEDAQLEFMRLQRELELKHVALSYVLFYKTMVDNGLPEDIAKEIVRDYHISQLYDEVGNGGEIDTNG